VTAAAQCRRFLCHDPATRRLTLLQADGKPVYERVYCEPHCDELTGRLVPSYPGGRPAFTVEAIA
jgi:hypothetical protein